MNTTIKKSSEIISRIYPGPFGDMLIGSHQGKICLCDWQHRKMRKKIDKRLQSYLGATIIDGHSEIIEHCIQQLDEYFGGTREEFDLPVILAGTEFQKSVWNELSRIPYGKTCTYLDLAVKLGNKGAIRAVAAANGDNAISVIIPCHRVIGSDGSLTGYAGGLRVKKRLLQLESGGRSPLQLDLF